METEKKQLSEPTFTHLNVHSHYSFLNGLSKIPELISKAQKDGMYSMALTDHSGMFGIKEFLNTVEKTNANRAEGEPAFKPIVGMDAYCAQRTLYDKSCNHWEKDPVTKESYLVDYAGWRLTLLAKNLQGYYSLCRLTSLSYIDGLFKDIPRIDRFVLAKNKDGIIVLSGGIKGELSQLILQGKTAEAEHLAAWFKEKFGDDYYIELNRHKTDKPNADREQYGLQMKVEPELIRIARKLEIKIVATNDVHFVLEEHGEAHDRLLCLASHKNFDDPKRHHYTKQEWLKSPKEMYSIFGDLPEALENTMEIANKVEMYSVNTTPQWPSTHIPIELCDTIKTENEYLEYLVWNGAQKRYGESNGTAHIQRITSELNVIKKKGVAGYFLMIWNIVKAAREELGVCVGPGRGSAACSIVAYCLNITDIDPLFFNLPFERFFSTQSKSIPDIDLDFDGDGRDKVLDWVKKNYGEKRVAHIISYGALGPKTSLAEMQRLEKMPIETINALKRLVPDYIKDENDQYRKLSLKNCCKYVPGFRSIMESDDDKMKQTISLAAELEDTIHSMGIHACGIAIAQQDICNIAPVFVAKTGTEGDHILATQYDAHSVEDVGLVKVDFLGLNALTTIKRCVNGVRHKLGIELDIDHIPLDDELTYKLFSEGNTVGVFQFESTGLQMKLRQLQTRSFNDLIALNALYRPGSMHKIPQLIDRKQGKEEISYILPEMEQYLKETYGITVYQEQIMLLSQKLADFTPNLSNSLRKAIGLKQKDVLEWLEIQFYEGGLKNGHSKETLAQIWNDWMTEGRLCFNKSHAVSYTWVAYQTAFLKAHYPAEYMTTLITQVHDDKPRFEQLVKDCQANGLYVEDDSPIFTIGKGINVSIPHFTVRRQQENGTTK